MGGAVTGEGGDRIVCDDPNNVNEVESDSVRKTTNDWFDVVMSTRVNDPKTAAKVVVMQRCHQQDLSGHAPAPVATFLGQLLAEDSRSARVILVQQPF